MAILRSGKITNPTASRKKVRKPKKNLKLKPCFVRIERLNVDQINLLSGGNRNKYSLRTRIVRQATIIVPKQKKISESNQIWKNLIEREYVLGPGCMVLAKMNNYRPWPARINSIYKVGDVTKCYVYFYGTFQIGSVLKMQCVPISECHLFFIHAIGEIKTKYKWKLNYEEMAKTNDMERSVALTKITQVQKFLLAIRDVEIIHEVPFESSVIQNDSNGDIGL